jgi:RimJ/RimL family protein N-acetyltransferase
MKVDDGILMIDYLNSVASESDNLTFGSGDIEFTLDKQTSFLTSVLSCELNYYAVAKIDGIIIGNINFSAGLNPRIKHAGEFGISVLKKYWGNGIANELLTSLINWAKSTKCIGKINLQVREDNENAIKLYKKHGFEIEGLITRTFRIDGKYYNSYHMGKFID